MALAAKRRVVINAGRKRKRRRNLTPKQIKFFGTPAQKAALKRRRANSGSRARNTARRSRSYFPRKHRAKNPGEILSLVLNPGGTKKGKKNMAKARKSHSASGRRHHSRRRSVANVTHHKRRRAKANPARRYHRRRNYTRHHRRRHNPPRGQAGFMQGVLFLVGGGVGFFGSKALAQMILQANNTGITGYFGNAAATAGLAIVAQMLPPTRRFAPAIVAGGVLQLLMRVITDQTGIGSTLSSMGIGDYQMQNFVTPQRLVDPLNSAAIEIPTGWGAAAPVAISTAAPPGAPAPALPGAPAAMHPAAAAAMSGYSSAGFGRSMYSSQGIYS